VPVAAVAAVADAVDPAGHVTVLADESDNRVLEAAAAGRVDLIVTGGKAMQELGLALPRLHPWKKRFSPCPKCKSGSGS
jgi:hypothetical protein